MTEYWGVGFPPTALELYSVSVQEWGMLMMRKGKDNKNRKRGDRKRGGDRKTSMKREEDREQSAGMSSCM